MSSSTMLALRPCAPRCEVSCALYTYKLSGAVTCPWESMITCVALQGRRGFYQFGDVLWTRALMTWSETSRPAPTATNSDARLRNVHRIRVDELGPADHPLGGVIRLLADVLEQLHARVTPQREPAGEQCGVCAWIVDRDLVRDRRLVRPREALDRVQLV